MQKIIRRVVVVLALLIGTAAVAVPPRTKPAPKLSRLFFSVQRTGQGRTFSQIYSM